MKTRSRVAQKKKRRLVTKVTKPVSNLALEVITGLGVVAFLIGLLYLSVGIH